MIPMLSAAQLVDNKERTCSTPAQVYVSSSCKELYGFGTRAYEGPTSNRSQLGLVPHRLVTV